MAFASFDFTVRPNRTPSKNCFVTGLVSRYPNASDPNWHGRIVVKTLDEH